MTGFSANWEAPAYPSDYDGQTIFLWIGIMDNSTGYGRLMQPVLEWGPSYDNTAGCFNGQGIQTYAINSWFVDSNLGEAYYGTAQCGIPEYDTVYGSITQTSCNSITCAYDTNIYDSDYDYSASFGPAGFNTSNLPYWGYVVLETADFNVYNECGDYPASGSTYFDSISQSDSSGSITPSWSGTIWVNDGCGEGGSYSSSYVDLTY